MGPSAGARMAARAGGHAAGTHNTESGSMMASTMEGVSAAGGGGRSDSVADTSVVDCLRANPVASDAAAPAASFGVDESDDALDGERGLPIPVACRPNREDSETTGDIRCEGVAPGVAALAAPPPPITPAR